MPIEEFRLDSLKKHLVELPSFLQSAEEIKQRPFLNPKGKNQPPISLEDARSTKLPRAWFLFSLAASSVLIVASCFAIIWLLVVFSDAAQLLKALKASLKHLTIQGKSSAPVISQAPWVALGILVVLLACVLICAFSKLAKYPPDTLFSGLLQEKFKATKSPSGTFVASLLSDWDFQKIFDDAVASVFPDLQKLDRASQPEGIYGSGFVEPNPLKLKSPEDWKGFVERVVDKAAEDERFVRFCANHASIDLTDPFWNSQLDSYLREAMRQLLFEEIFNNRSFAYIYKNTPRIWHKVVKWLTTLDIDKAQNVIKSPGHESKKTDQLPVYAGLLILAVILSGHIAGSPDKGKSPLTLQVSPIPKIEGKLTIEGNPTANITVSPITIKPLSQAGEIAVKPITITHSGEVDVKPTGDFKVSGTMGLVSSGDINLKASDLTLNLKGLPASQICCEPQNAGGDDFATFFPDRQNEATATLLLHPPGDADPLCSFTLKIADLPTSTKPDSPMAKKVWPPDPVALTIDKVEIFTNPGATNVSSSTSTCLKLPDPSEKSPPYTVYAGKVPVYSPILHAYLSIEEANKRRPYFLNFKHSILVVRASYRKTPDVSTACPETCTPKDEKSTTSPPPNSGGN